MVSGEDVHLVDAVTAASVADYTTVPSSPVCDIYLLVNKDKFPYNYKDIFDISAAIEHTNKWALPKIANFALGSSLTIPDSVISDANDKIGWNGTTINALREYPGAWSFTPDDNTKVIW